MNLRHSDREGSWDVLFHQIYHYKSHYTPPLPSCCSTQMDPHQAAADLTKHAAWRAAWCPQQRVLEVSMSRRPECAEPYS